MRETERVGIMERMRKKVKVREKRMREETGRKRERMREKDLIQKMAFVALNPLQLTIFRLLHSVRVSIDPRSREFLIFAFHGVNEALELLKSLENFRDCIGSKRLEAFEGEIREGAREFENVLDSYVSDQFLSQSENEKQLFLFSLKLREIEQDIDGFIQMVIRMAKLLNPWLDEKEPWIEEEPWLEEEETLCLSEKEPWIEEEEDDDDNGGEEPWLEEEEEEDDDDDNGGEEPWLEEEKDDDNGGEELHIFGLFNQPDVDVTKTLFRSWLPMPVEEEREPYDGGDDVGGDLVRPSLIFRVDPSKRWFISWFATKAASVFLGMKEEYIQDLENLLPQEEEDDDYTVLFTTDIIKFSEKRFRKIKGDLMIWWINKAAASIFVMESDYTQRFVNPLPEDDTAVKMVGSTDLFHRIRDDLLKDFRGLRIGSIIGMAGIGKTALAKRIIEDPLILSKFECCIFVRMGPEYDWEETLLAILAQMPNGDKMLIVEDVYKTLKVRKCLIVLDDFWNRDPNDIFKLFPWGSSQSAILFTTRIQDTAILAQMTFGGNIYEVPFLNKEESWDLLRGKIFGQKRCLPQLEKAGKKIAENCEGLPLLILVVGGLLSQAEKTPEYWSKVAANKTNSIFVDAYEQVSDVVYPSYYYLPQHLKACFLYLGAFPQNDEVRISRLISLWSADGFLGVRYAFLQEHADDLLGEIVSNNVALGTQWSTFHHRLKALTLHSVCWYLCKSEARNENFLHVLNSYKDASVQGIKTQSRLSIYNNTILSIKDVRDSIASISVVRSLLCTGPYHQYEVPICLGKLRLLKVLDVLTIRFYEFPTDVVKLVLLRYLALTCNGNLPPSISNLWGLQCLILHQHLSIKSSSVSHSYLPVEIWDLLELEHLQIKGRNLPDPPPGKILRNLLILLDVGAHTCTERVLASIPNLKKLRVQIELIPVAVEPLRFCDDIISHLESLDSLQLVVVNPELKFEIVAPAPSFSLSLLTKLTLSGFGYPWKEISSIAELAHLQDLKLKCYAFRGEKWVVKEGQFKLLRYLLIEDTDLVQWTAEDLNFQYLRYLTIRNCYRLLELPKISYLMEIQVVDCNPSAVTSAKQMTPSSCRNFVESSWLDDGKLS